MNEQQIQKLIIKFLEGKGAYIVNVVSASRKGVPDIVCCYKGKFIGIEVKLPKTKHNVSALQLYNLKQIEKANGISLVAWSVTCVKSYLAKHFDFDDLGYLYMLYDVKGEWIKVGKTSNPTQRLIIYNSGFSDSPLSYMYLTERLYNSSGAERELLISLKSKIKNKRKAEWFKPVNPNSVLNEIKHIEDKYFYGNND